MRDVKDDDGLPAQTYEMRTPPFIIMRLAPDFANPGTGITMSVVPNARIMHDETEATTELTRLCDDNPGITFVLFIGIRAKMARLGIVKAN